MNEKKKKVDRYRRVNVAFKPAEYVKIKLHAMMEHLAPGTWVKKVVQERLEE